LAFDLWRNAAFAFELFLARVTLCLREKRLGDPGLTPIDFSACLSRRYRLSDSGQISAACLAELYVVALIRAAPGTKHDNASFDLRKIRIL